MLRIDAIQSDLSAKDIIRQNPGVPVQTIYSRIRAMEKSGQIFACGHGLYSSVPKVKFKTEVTSKMLEISAYLIDQCEGVDTCISSRKGNLYVEVHKSDIQEVVSALRSRYDNVFLLNDIVKVKDSCKEFIIVSSMVSESPVCLVEGVEVPSVEKAMVDAVFSGELEGTEIHRMIQRYFEAYRINRSTLLRYASRRGIRPRMESELDDLDLSRLTTVNNLQIAMKTLPIERAWVFGSFARGEERPDSDIDLLVDYADSESLSLLDVSRFSLALQKASGRQIDLIENGELLPFAIESSKKDKYLIYERAG